MMLSDFNMTGHDEDERLAQKTDITDDEPKWFVL